MPTVADPILINLSIAVSLMWTIPEAVLAYEQTIVNSAIKAYITYIVIILLISFFVILLLQRGKGAICN